MGNGLKSCNMGKFTSESLRFYSLNQNELEQKNTSAKVFLISSCLIGVSCSKTDLSQDQGHSPGSCHLRCKLM